MLTKEAEFWGLLGACCTLPRKNVHDTRMNINHLFCALYLYVKHCLNILHINIILITTYEVGTIIIPILQIQKQKHRQVKYLGQGHTGCHRWSGNQIQSPKHSYQGVLHAACCLTHSLIKLSPSPPEAHRSPISSSRPQAGKLFL